ncbi:MAG: glycosyltransferase, partial [Gaiellaceae bacterium]
NAARGIGVEVRRFLGRGRATAGDRVAYLGLGITWQLAHAYAYASCPPISVPPVGEADPGAGRVRAFPSLADLRQQSDRLWWLIRRPALLRDRLRAQLVQTLPFQVRDGFRIARRAIVPWTKCTTARLLLRAGRTPAAFDILARLHQEDASETAARLAEQVARQAADDTARAAGSRATGPDLYRDYASTLRPLSWAEGYFRNPSAILGMLVLVIKPRTAGQRGVVVFKNNYTFSHMLRFFDLERIASAYHVVLEPSWSGYCHLDILQYCSVSAPIFVEAAEPRDAEFIGRLGANLVAVPVASNWWVDHRVFRPLPGTTKDTDVVMVAAWARYKRHFQFLKVLGDLRRRGRRLAVSLIGYTGDMTRHDVADMAATFDVSDQVEIYDDVPQEQVNELLNRARVSLIWSLREGVNRAIIESMFAGVPCVLRDGFNYGHKYAFINERTGRFTTEGDLVRTLLDVMQSSDRYAPREWVSANMSCQRATALLEETIGARAKALGEPWSGGLAVKTNNLQ